MKISKELEEKNKYYRRKIYELLDLIQEIYKCSTHVKTMKIAEQLGIPVKSVWRARNRWIGHGLHRLKHEGVVMVIDERNVKAIGHARRDGWSYIVYETFYIYEHEWDTVEQAIHKLKEMKMRERAKETIKNL